MQNRIIEDERQEAAIDTGNNLFPVFLKMESLRLLIVGGGNVAVEKLGAVIQNSPNTLIRIVSLTVSEKIYEIAEENKNISIDKKPYSIGDLDDSDIVIVAVNNITTSEQIRNDAHKAGRLVNVADKPELCDFY